jgi:hypothetical protein
MTETGKPLHDHRAAILGSIRQSLGKADEPAAIAAEYAGITRSYSRTGRRDQRELLEFFAERLVEYDAGVYRAETSEIAGTIAQILTTRGKTVPGWICFR